MTTKPRKAPPHLYDSLFTVRTRVLNLLEEMEKEYPALADDGTFLAHRLAVAKYAAEAKGIRAVMAACDSYSLKEDIL